MQPPAAAARPPHPTPPPHPHTHQHTHAPPQLRDPFFADRLGRKVLVRGSTRRGAASAVATLLFQLAHEAGVGTALDGSEWIYEDSKVRLGGWVGGWVGRGSRWAGGLVGCGSGAHVRPPGGVELPCWVEWSSPAGVDLALRQHGSARLT
jgi:hypothetical protein